MGQTLVYQAVKSKFLQCREEALQGIITPDEAGEIYERLSCELADQYGTELTEQIMNTFTADLRLLTIMEWLDRFGPIAVIVGYVSAFVFSEQRINRVVRLNDDILQLDTKYSYTKPDDTS